LIPPSPQLLSSSAPQRPFGVALRLPRVHPMNTYCTPTPGPGRGLGDVGQVVEGRMIMGVIREIGEICGQVVQFAIRNPKCR